MLVENRVPTPTHLLATIERNRRRLWAICYRMTGSTADAEDLCQEAIARAIERADDLHNADPTGWMTRIAANACLDHLRRRTVRQRVTELCDPLDLPELEPGVAVDDPARAAILRDDVRFAIVVALQHLTPRQRAALILCDVCDQSLEEVATALDVSPNAAKAVLHRARVALARARHREDVDVPVDRDVVERLATAIEAGSLDRIATLLAEDAWGVVDGGGIVQVATQPSFGRRSVIRRFGNFWRRLGAVPLAAELRRLNGEPTVIVRIAAAGPIVAAIHVESARGHVVALRIDRDPRRLARFARPES